VFGCAAGVWLGMDSGSERLEGMTDKMDRDVRLAHSSHTPRVSEGTLVTVTLDLEGGTAVDGSGARWTA